MSISVVVVVRVLLLLGNFVTGLVSFSLHHSCLLSTRSKNLDFDVQLEKTNAKESIVILHGLLGSSKNFQSWSKLLSLKLDGEYDIVCMDLR